MELVYWFLDYPGIPQQTRDDFLAHLIETNTIDERSYNWMTQQALSILEKAAEQEQQLDEEIQWIENNIQREKNPKTSTHQKWLKEAIQEIDRVGISYINQSKDRIKAFAQTIEDYEQDTEESQIAAIKANL